MQKLEEQMQDMRLQLQAEMTELCQGNVKPELQKVQGTLTEMVQWRADINAKLTEYVTLNEYPAASLMQRSMHEADAQHNETPSKHHPGKLATARLQRHALTLRANSRVKKKRVKQHRMTPL